MYTRSEERESSTAYQAWLGESGPGAAFMRFLMGPAGTFLVNTPLFLLQRRLGITSKHRVLDIGCGRGAALRFLASRIRFERPPIGIDIAPAILQYARRDQSNDRPLDLVAAAATRLPFAPESFDLVLSLYLVKHLGDDAIIRFFYECCRVLRPGGVLVLWEFAPTRSPLLNRFHHWLLTPRVKTSRLRGFGDFVDIAIESPFANMEILELRPFLFPPIPRTALILKKADKKAEQPRQETEP